MITAVRAITLDAAGTLIHVTHPVGDSYSRIAAAHGMTVDGAQVAKAFRSAFPAMPPLAFAATDRPHLECQERDWWRTLVRHCLGAEGQHPAFGAFFDDLYGFYRGGDAWTLYPEVSAVLDALETAAIPVAVISNFDSRLHAVLQDLGVHGRFRSVICSSEAGAAKPDRSVFHAGCRALGAAPESVLHAGDDRRADWHGACAAGLRALWLRRGAGDGTATDSSIRDLTGILAYI